MEVRIMIQGSELGELCLGVVYTMDHEVVPMSCKICDWLLNLSLNHFRFPPLKKNVKMNMEFEISKRHILRPTLSIDMVQWVLWWGRQKRCSGRKRQGPMAKKCCYNKILLILFWKQKMKTIERSNLIFLLSSKMPFLGIHLKKNSTFIFLVNGSHIG